MRISKLILIITTIAVFCNNVFSREWQGGASKKSNSSTTNKSVKSAMAGCTPATASTYLELNNVRALIHTGGDMWWDLQGTAKYVIPKDNEFEASSLFAGSIWIGGKDINNQLKIAAMRFRQDGVDYWPGPLVTSGLQQASVSDTICQKYDRHFSISKADVSLFRTYINATDEERAILFPDGYSIPKIILDWPAHGEFEQGYTYYLAPFKDVNGNNVYEPYSGDYPFFDLDGSEVCGTSRENRKVRLYGDQTLWWVYNDRGNIHTETGGDAIGMEIHGQAFAFSTNDELNNMTFYNYEIINRSTYTLKDTYFGIWTDADLGAADDDYVGCDVNRGLGFLYNGDATDGISSAPSTGTYGANPPAIGVDFFEGPYQDADGVDNLSNWNAEGEIDCTNGYRYDVEGKKQLIGSGDINNGNINGLNFGDGIADNERWGMRRFIYFNNATGPAPTQDPSTATEHYNYLIGKWKSGDPMYYGGNGYNTHLPANQITDFMFPGTTDPCGWGQKGVVMPSWDEYNGTAANNPAGDRRFVQSAGPFVLEPGMVNDITTGIVWARAEAGECGSGVPQEYCSVLKVQTADDKAQKLFESCFKVLDGPDAPELSIIELDKELVIQLWNKKTSNNYLESYNGKDPFISCPIGSDGKVTDCDKFFKFQGYQVFQLKDKSVSVSELHNSEKAMLVFQCDIKDGVSQIINYTWSQELKANIPTEEVYGSDNGIKHTFRVNSDMFGKEDKALVNHKKYYYLAIAYAYNNYKTYNMTNPDALDGQLTPYKAGRKTADGGTISPYEAMPHLNDNLNGGTVLNSEYGDLLQITQLDGYGGGYNILELEDESINKIMSGEPWKVDSLKYKKGFGPIKIKVVDPLNIPEGDYVLKMISDSVRKEKGYYYFNTYYNPDSLPYDVDGYIVDSKWVIESKSGSTTTLNPIYSDSWISLENEQIISDLGLAIEISQTPYPLAPQAWANQPLTSAKYADNAGYLSSSIEYADNSKQWLWFLSDGDGHDFQDWIKSGTEKYSGTINDDKCDDVFDDRTISSPLFPIEDASIPMDPDEVFEKILDGTWAPYKLTSDYFNGTAKTSGLSEIKSKEKRLSNVDIVFTSDKSKWTRCPVIETTNNDIKLEDNENGPQLQCEVIGSTNSYSIGGAKMFEMRKSPSVDKEGKSWAQALTYPDSASTNPDDPHFISATGMGWFPGYAIDVETGERLNLMFGEASRLVGENGADMKWNPTNRLATDLYMNTGVGDILMGGKHFIYILGHNTQYKSAQIQTTMNAYDYGKMSRELIVGGSIKNKELFMNAMWVSIPMYDSKYEFLATDVKIKLRVVSPYKKKLGSFASKSDDLAPNRNMPCYSFSTKSIATTKNSSVVLENALQYINVVPNPYYGYNEYELAQMDNAVRITNLPKECVVSIYTVNGTMVRKWNKGDLSTYIEWDLKTMNNISISGGIYVIHIEVPGVGERVIKWFGALRPIDLQKF